MVKRLMSIAVATMVVLVLGINPAYAAETDRTPPTGLVDGVPQDRPERPPLQDGEEPPEPPEDGEEPPALPEGATGLTDEAQPPRGGRRDGGASGKDGAPPDDDGRSPMLNVDAVQSAIDALEDADAQAALTALLTAYQTALSAERSALDSQANEAVLTVAREAVSSAYEALAAALTAQGIDPATLTPAMAEPATETAA